MSRFLGRFRASEAGGLLEPRASAAEMAEWTFLNLTSEGVVLLDASQTIVNLNAAALELMQSTRAAAIGHSFWYLTTEPVADEHQTDAERALAQSKEYRFVVHEEFADSWVEYVIRRLPEGDVVNLRDVAVAQRQARSLASVERYNRIIFDASPTAMWMFDVTTLKVLGANQAAVAFYETPRAQFLKSSVASLFPDEDASTFLELVHASKSSDDPKPRLSLCSQKKLSGLRVLVELAWSFVDWEGQQAVMVSVVDVSQRHLADGALRRVNAVLEQTVTTLRTELNSARHELLSFTQAISSDLQDSLHAADGFSVRLAEKYAAVLDESGRHYIRRIQVSIRQLSKLVDDLRTLAQVSQRDPHFEHFDLVPVCQLVVAGLQKREPGRIVVIEMPPAMLTWGDRRALSIAIACLLENAWKFSAKRDQAWISIALAPGAMPGESILQVSDNGAGFDPVYGAKLFTAFQRLHSSADFPGNGLGLAIVKRVADLHHGRVWAESGVQVGATFFMALAGAASERTQNLAQEA